MIKNLKKLIASTFLSVLATAGTAMPVLAAPFTYNSVSGTSTSFTKVITTDPYVKTPNVTYHYTVTAGEAQSASGTNIAIYSGTDSLKTNGVLPTIKDVVFSAKDSADATPTTTQTVTKTATVDFSGVRFKSPGCYRYVLTESGTAQGLVEDASDTDRIKALDVYVIDNNGTLEIAGYVLHNDQTSSARKLSETTRLDDKAAGFEALYETSNVELSKTVKGNQASKEQYFEFTVDITGADANTEYTVDLSKADATTVATASNAETHENPSVIVTDANGKATVTFWLQHGQSVNILGFANKTGYSITEDNKDYDVKTVATEGKNSTEGTSVTVSDTAVTEDSTVAYTNTRDSLIPTGIFLDGSKGVTVALFGAALTGGVILYMKKKKDGETHGSED